MNKEQQERQKHLERIGDRLFEQSGPNTNEWFGAILRYFWFKRKRNFNSIYSVEELKTNKKVGRWFIVCVVVSIITISLIWIKTC
ncbi:MAG: hypothetical protein HRU50_10955 [Winogradskyella sp.]|uniref:hypothetical protein n=1 Tax=Winogradskyella sp. TaxID=1883156 RepID=UPI0025D73B26|nr:hypothetical protein [Winogradskyella sp.]NRB60441.1 hypothetical protein [Winogradskyella sp.]